MTTTLSIAVVLMPLRVGAGVAEETHKKRKEEALRTPAAHGRQSGPAAVTDWHVEFTGHTVVPPTTQVGTQEPPRPAFWVVQPATVAPVESVSDGGSSASHFQPAAQAVPPTVQLVVQNPRSVVVSERQSQALPVTVVELQLVSAAVMAVSVVTHAPTFVWHSLPEGQSVFTEHPPKQYPMPTTPVVSALYPAG
jgi:hypothetical protein